VRLAPAGAGVRFVWGLAGGVGGGGGGGGPPPLYPNPGFARQTNLAGH